LFGTLSKFKKEQGSISIIEAPEVYDDSLVDIPQTFKSAKSKRAEPKKSVKEANGLGVNHEDFNKEKSFVYEFKPIKTKKVVTPSTPVGEYESDDDRNQQKDRMKNTQSDFDA
jgi:hypothetical protein